ncbi:ECF transporter S component [candidate division WOR-3 bacterium]|nr:ECF transporter S component [candidate division WOR-3 bacterium]
MERIRFVSRVAIFSALAIAMGYVLSFIPNLELTTSIIFLSGVLLGSVGGMMVGAISFLIFGFFNPLGPSPLPLLLSQIIGGMFIGLLGAFYGKKCLRRVYIIVILGILSTLFYDMITTSVGWFLFPTKKTFIVYLIAGLPFVLWHIGTQSAIYGMILFPIIQRIKQRR